MMRPVLYALPFALWLFAEPALGQFGTAQPIFTSNGNVELRAADIDSDGDMDLFGVFNGHHFKWFENTDGQGTFSGPTTVLSLGNDCQQFVLADVDNDLDPDLIVISENENLVLIHTNDGTGGFSLYESLQTPTDPEALACADVTGDGEQDLIVTLWVNGGAGFGIFPGGTDGFGSLVTFGNQHPGSPSQLIRVADLDLIGGMDVLLRGANDELTISRNTVGDGTVWTPAPISIPDGPTSYSYRSPRLLDVDGDGDLDLAESRGPAVHWLRNDLDEGGILNFSENVIEAWDTSGNGVFGPSACGVGASLVYVPNNPSLSVRWNSFLPELDGFAYSNDLALPRGQNLLLADFNGDGRDDLTMTTGDGILWFPSTLSVGGNAIQLPPLDTLCVAGAPVPLPDAIPFGGRWYGTQVSNDLLFRANLGVTMDLPLVHAVYAQEGCPMAATTSIRLITSPVITTSIPTVLCSADAMIPLHSEPNSVQWYGLDGSDVIDPATWNGGFIVCEFTDQTGFTCSDVEGPIQRWNSLPAAIAEAGPFCSTDQVQTILAAAVPPNNVTWSGPVTGSTPTSTQFDPAQGAGEYTIILDVEPYGPNQCRNSDTLHITVHPTPVIQFTPPTAYCAISDPITLDWVTPTNGFWSGPGVEGGIIDPAVAGPGDHLLSYFAVSDEGCGSQAGTTIQFVDAATVTTVLEQTLLCAYDEPVQFTATPTGGAWNMPLSADGVLDPSSLIPGPVVISYNYIDPRGCELNSAEMQVEVGAPKLVSILNIGDLCFDGEPVELIGSETGSWSGALTGEGPSLMVDPGTLGLGSFEITLTVANENQCIGTASVQFEIDICSGAEAPSLTEMVVAPNPFRDGTTVRIGAKGTVSLEVFDATGQLVLTRNSAVAGTARLDVDLRDRSPGIYLIRVITGGQIHLARVIKSN